METLHCSLLSLLVTWFFLEPAILDINEFNGEISPLAKVEFDENF